MKENSPEWNDKLQLAIKKLINYARSTSYKERDPYMSYGEFEGIVGLPIGFFGMPQANQFLRQVCEGAKESTLTSGDILLSALIATKGTGVPGPGFYELAMELGFTKKDMTEKSIFAHRQRQRVFEFYQRSA